MAEDKLSKLVIIANACVFTPCPYTLWWTQSWSLFNCRGGRAVVDTEVIVDG